jgi:hypothetical protein
VPQRFGKASAQPRYCYIALHQFDVTNPVLHHIWRHHQFTMSFPQNFPSVPYPSIPIFMLTNSVLLGISRTAPRERRTISATASIRRQCHSYLRRWVRNGDGSVRQRRGNAGLKTAMFPGTGRRLKPAAACLGLIWTAPALV